MDLFGDNVDCIWSYILFFDGEFKREREREREREQCSGELNWSGIVGDSVNTCLLYDDVYWKGGEWSALGERSGNGRKDVWIVMSIVVVIVILIQLVKEEGFKVFKCFFLNIFTVGLYFFFKIANKW